MRTETDKMPESTISPIGNAPASLMTDLGQRTYSFHLSGHREGIPRNPDAKPGSAPSRFPAAASACGIWLA